MVYHIKLVVIESRTKGVSSLSNGLFRPLEATKSEFWYGAVSTLPGRIAGLPMSSRPSLSDESNGDVVPIPRPVSGRWILSAPRVEHGTDVVINCGGPAVSGALTSLSASALNAERNNGLTGGVGALSLPTPSALRHFGSPPIEIDPLSAADLGPTPTH